MKSLLKHLFVTPLSHFGFYLVLIYFFPVLLPPLPQDGNYHFQRVPAYATMVAPSPTSPNTLFRSSEYLLICSNYGVTDLFCQCFDATSKVQ